jgi:branched-chain amino acid transport system ATP-binding protein
VTLDVEDGDFVAILGANGAGKTTTLRAISGTVKTSGDVFFDGHRLFRRTPEAMARRGIAHVPEGRGTFATLSVLDNLRLGAWVQKGTSQRDLAHVFEFFPRLFERRDQQAGTLSGGEQQMLAVGRALVTKPRLLLVDEMSLGLAPVIVERLLPILRRVATDLGAGVLFVEQHVAKALQLADRAYVLSHGRLVLEGPAEELRKRPDLLKSSYLGDVVAA